jgi:prefoldin subunit 5
MMENQSKYDAQRGQPREAEGRLAASLNRLQKSVSTLTTFNEQLEHMANRLTGEAPTSASVSKLGQPENPAGSVTHAIDRECERIEQQLSRQQDALQRLQQL